MAESARKSAGIVRGVAVALVVVAVVGLIYLVTGGGTKTGTAYFASTKSIYPGDTIRILGLEVGAIDSIKNEGNRVRVDFHYDSKYTVPAEAKAAILSPTLVATRFIQLDPPYTGGPALEDGGVIPVERTVVPVEFDELKKQLSQLADALGPTGVNKDGSLNRALTVIHNNGVQDGVGQGQPFHDMITELSKAAKTLSDGRGDLFGTVRNLAEFSAVLGTMDAQIIEFDRRLADVSGTLTRSNDTLRELLPEVDKAGVEIDKFLDHHADDLVDAVDTAGSVTRMLAQRRDDIAQALHLGPNVLTNWNNLWHPRDQRLFGALSVNQAETFGGPGDMLCAMIAQTAAADQKQGQDMCVKYLGPVFQYLATKPPPVGVHAPVETHRGSTPSYGDLTRGQADTGDSSGTRSDVPRSETANGNGHRFDNGPAGLPNLMQGGN